MFSFHKPKIYRSNLGCCICKAKSSSSRFTDSKKYENEFERCFRIQEERSGEICNACVLLVKRWKKLSPENRLTKHWHHVVDARAGPGTKLTGNRRLGSNSGSSTSGGLSDSSQPQQRRQQSTVSPLSSSQANNQSSGHSSSLNGANNTTSTSSTSSNAGRKRTGSFNKARAIDTNVSTFTFGEPVYRRSYMTTESSFVSSALSTCSSSSLAKPQSALNSSAFESVIKRFRQRQQQQQLEAQRRHLNRQQRLSQQQPLLQRGVTADGNRQLPAEQVPDRNQVNLDDERPKNCSDKSSIGQTDNEHQGRAVTVPVALAKRLKRSSESIGSLSIDGLRVASLLDSSLWRKEKICCGIIFRGPCNEVAMFPKSLKPCQCRLNEQLKQRQQQERLTNLVASNQEEENPLARGGRAESSPPPPPPRTAKSGSISSCDSNTSGTGSMEQPVEEQVSNAAEISIGRQRQQRVARRQQASEKPQTDTASSSTPRPSGNKQRPVQPVTRRRQRQQQAASRKLNANDLDSNTSSSSSSVLSPPTATVPAAAAERVPVPEEGGSRKGSLSSSANQQEMATLSPASSSGASSSRLRVVGSEVEDEFEEEEEDEDDEMVDDEDIDDAELMDEDEDVESITDASSSVDSLAEVERKKSTSHVVGAMG